MLNDCCSPCPTVQNTNIPGPEGQDGNDGDAGADGINAFTFTTADFTVPAIGDQVTISVIVASWMIVDQLIKISGAGVFQVISVGNPTTVTLEYMNYSTNTNATAVIPAGTGVSPSGSEPSVTLLPSISEYAVGGSQALTATPSQLLSLDITLPAVKSYLIFAQVRLDFVVCTFPANHTATMKLRRTNNTPGDLTNAAQAVQTPVVTAESSTFRIITIPPVVYVASAGDIIQLFGSVDVTPYSGALQAISGNILAIPLF